MAAGGGARPEDRGFRIAAALTRIGDTDATIVHALALALLAPPGRQATYLGVIGGALILATLAAQILKRAVRRPRPSTAIAELQCSIAPPDAYSFPSGHASAAFALGSAAACLDARLGAIELLLAAAIAVSRVRLGAHYPGDVAAGVALGLITGLSWPTFL
jgi:undecaprenyl-diphosphatase